MTTHQIFVKIFGCGAAQSGFKSFKSTLHWRDWVRGGAVMYAVIETGGKQYRVQQGDVVFVEKLDVEEGSNINFENVLVMSKDGDLVVGKPYVDGAKVEAVVLEQGKAKKIVVFKFKAKKNYRKKQGHRQPFTKVRIENIVG